MKKETPNFKNMTKEEIQEWQEKLNSIEIGGAETHQSKTIRQGRGWIF